MATAASLIMNLEARTSGFESGMKRARQSAKDTSNVIRAEFGKGLQTTFSQTQVSAGQLFSALGVGAAVAVAIKLADNYNQITQRIRIATAATGDFKQVNEALFRIAQNNGTAFKDTVSVFQRLSLAAGDLGASNKQIETVVDTVQKLGIVSGATTEELSSGMLQLSQALASGRLQGDELRSIMENMPALARKIAEGLKVPIGQLKALGAEGKLASKEVFDAILKAAPQVESEFSRMPVSIDRAFMRLQNSMLQALGSLDQATGASQILAGGMELLAKGIERVREELDKLSQINIGGHQTNVGRLVSGLIESAKQAHHGISDPQKIRDIVFGEQKGATKNKPIVNPIVDPKAAKAAQTQFEHFQKIVRQLEAQNTELELTLKHEGAEAEILKKIASAREQVGRSLTSQEKIRLRGLVVQEQEIKGSIAIQQQNKSLDQQIATLKLKLQHREKEIPLMEIENQLLSQNIKLDAEQRAGIAQRIQQMQTLETKSAFKSIQKDMENQAVILEATISKGERFANIQQQRIQFEEQIKDLAKDQQEYLRGIFDLVVKRNEELQNRQLLESLEDQNMQLEAQLNLEEKLLGIRRLERDLAKGRISQEVFDKAKALELENIRLQDQIKIQAVADELFDKNKTSVKQLAERTLELKQALDAGLISTQDFNRELVQTRTRLAQSHEVAASFASTITSGFENAIFSGQRFGDVLRGLLRDLANVAAKALLFKPFENYLTTTFAGLGGSSVSSLFGKTGAFFKGLIPGFATGGRPGVGELSLVGENGPELFVPDSSGTVIPLNRAGLAGGGSTNVSVNVFNYSNARVDQQESVEPDGSRRVDLVISDIVADNIRRGGAVMRALSERTGLKPRGILR